MPGWRVGWVTVYDRSTSTPPVMAEVKNGLKRLTQLILGASISLQSLTVEEVADDCAVRLFAAMID